MNSDGGKQTLQDNLEEICVAVRHLRQLNGRMFDIVCKVDGVVHNNLTRDLTEIQREVGGLSESLQRIHGSLVVGRIEELNGRSSEMIRSTLEIIDRTFPGKKDGST